MTQFETSTAG